MDLVKKRFEGMVWLITIFFIFSSDLVAQESEIGLTIKGKASYYHKKFHGRKTASGEVFSNLEYTCAHRTLPFGTMIEVENPYSHKWVIVRVNDRGPFTKTRVLDLSYQAAKEIGMIQKGIIFVNAKVVGKDGEVMLFREGSTEDNFFEIFPSDSVDFPASRIPETVSSKKQK
ncbi:septal ring lytic transglycosylase RlpA family protein [Lacihabitans sp. LS3-19]|uniref:septal ring lytic transglycosylase RlpA family protein n=1 Tax=Lacihabitans sp. LS3-19 TaxID=2487335 RepID=UPI0020CF5069|nr:septal ring lytic transglycosylase RlpA family protein [Lacihabitans sp. LS3-19]MCP9769007.1 septal ring lytic transglycosylase RlpA family protein [Lacihabitans sp. LS3-19]